MPYHYGAFNTAPMESAHGKFDLLDRENYELEENFGAPHPIPHFTCWEACLRETMIK